MGCAHYRDLSTTYYLEKHLGWSGIGVDALAEYRPEYEKERPHTKFCNFIVTDHSDTQESIYRVRRMRELSSTSLEYAKKESKGSGRYDELHAPTITLNELLRQHGISKLDFLSMDIEDSEPQALTGFDIQQFEPELVCIEAHPAVQQPILDYFTKNGYERIEKYQKYDSLNWYFKPKDSLKK